MRAIDYFDRGHDRDPARTAVLDVASSLSLSFAEAKARLGGVKTPKSVEFVEAIARTTAGKMDKKALRRAHWGETARMVN